MEENPIPRKIVNSSLWIRYEKDFDYINGSTEAIAKKHKLVILLEKRGLRKLIIKFRDNLSKETSYIEELKLRSSKDWIDEWNEMHYLLFSEILILSECGRVRLATERVYFGDPSNEYIIPQTPGEIYTSLDKVANEIKSYLYSINETTLDEKISLIAKIHFLFVVTHPYKDGNGRIARWIIDQLCLVSGLPAVMGSYPRHNKAEQKEYHNVIKIALENPSNPKCSELANWIKKYIENSKNFIL